MNDRVAHHPLKLGVLRFSLVTMCPQPTPLMRRLPRVKRMPESMVNFTSRTH